MNIYEAVHDPHTSKIERRDRYGFREGEPEPLTESSPADPIHWKCPDCFEECRCSDPDVQRMPHKACGAKRTKE